MIDESCRIWQPSNVYPSAQIGRNVQIGAFSEIGPAVIGDDVKIGAFAFIPGKIHIESGVWIGPRVTFTHTFPPATPDDWKETRVRSRAMIGAAVTILCGITIGEGSIIGAGSVVTKDVPAGEVWAGTPARYIRRVSENKEEDKT